MANVSKAPATIDEYIAAFPPRVRDILERIRRTVRTAAPEATEVISYRMPAFKRHGIVIYFAAFRHHIGLYPPLSGDARLMKAAAPYAGEKGNLRFLFDEPVPYDLIERVVLHRLKQNLAEAGKTKLRPVAAIAMRPVRSAKK